MQNNIALVVATYGKYALIEINNKQYNCTARSYINGLTVGDRVEYIGKDKNMVISKIIARKNLLRNNQKNIAANIDEIFLVLALSPYPQLESIDNYLIKAIASNINISIIVNKIDLDGLDKVKEEVMQIYQNIGYSVEYVSVEKNIGIDNIRQKLQNKTTVFVGQSGVGKSSVTNQLSNSQQKINILGKNGLGKHTTSYSSIYQFGNSKIIDTPGVREFNLTNFNFEEVICGFIEFKKYTNKCKFHNCKHLKESNCEIKTQVDLGNISKYRYQNYIKLITQILNV